MTLVSLLSLTKNKLLDQENYDSSTRPSKCSFVVPQQEYISSISYWNFMNISLVYILDSCNSKENMVFSDGLELLDSISASDSSFLWSANSYLSRNSFKGVCLCVYLSKNGLRLSPGSAADKVNRCPMNSIFIQRSTEPLMITNSKMLNHNSSFCFEFNHF
ncbi:hypothetical protein Lalb_Chr24g0398571 [Lupinus albus]|uniref:Uncharacterized protein n=1 Tax=Lupinus albus TaxID=3870 RepID=A0A6A4N3S9_LUPAL|nr:hypothetical protein Lalb_Chr24g0398571 [Lupinus albus]